MSQINVKIDSSISAFIATTAANSASQYANNASNSATQSANSATASANSAILAANSAIQAANSATQAANSATASANSAILAANSATASANSAILAANSAIQAANSATQAANSATASANSAILAANSATASANSAILAANSAIQAANSATQAANSATAANNAVSSTSQNVPTMATLRGLVVSTTRKINLTGYYADGDGGGGQFYGVTGAAAGTYVDNGGTVIVPSGGNGSAAWLRIVDGPIMVQWFGTKGNGVENDTAALQAAISYWASLETGILSSISNQRFAINNTLNFFPGSTYAHALHSIDFGGAFFLWTGSAVTTAPMWYFYNSKAAKIRNFTIFGTPTSVPGVPGSVTGIFLDSLQPNGSDTLDISDFNIVNCADGIKMGSVGADQNRVSDTNISGFVIENCVNCFSTRSTNVDNILFANGILSASTKGFDLQRAGFIKIDSVTGYGLTDFINISGPIGPLEIQNSQVEGGGVVGANFLTRTNYTASRQSPITFINCAIDLPVNLLAPGGTDIQIVSIIGGYFSNCIINAPNTILNLVGTNLISIGTLSFNANACLCNDIGSRLDGTIVDPYGAVSKLASPGFYTAPNRMKTQYGSIATQTVSGPGSVAVPVTFATPFNSTVFGVVVTPRSNGGAAIAAWCQDTITTTGFTAILSNSAGVAQNLGANWVAFGV